MKRGHQPHHVVVHPPVNFVLTRPRGEVVETVKAAISLAFDDRRWSAAFAFCSTTYVDMLVHAFVNGLVVREVVVHSHDVLFGWSVGQ